MKFKLKFDLKPRHRKLMAIIKVYWPTLLLAGICMMIVAAGEAATAWLMKPAVDDIIINRDQAMLMLIPVVIMAVYLIKGAAMYLQGYLMNRVGRSIIREFRDRLYDHIHDLPLSFFHSEKTGVLMSRIIHDVNIIRAMVSTAVTGALRDACSVAALMTTTFMLDWKMASFTFLVLPLAFYPIHDFGRRIRKIGTRAQETMAELSSFLHETFSGAKIIKAFGMETYEKQRFYDRTKDLYKIEMKEVKVDELSSPVMELIGGIGVAVGIYYGGYRIFHDTLTPGTFFAFISATVMLYRPIRKLSKLNIMIQLGLSATDRIYDILERDSDIVEKDDPIAIPLGPHSVVFEDVCFRYDQENNGDAFVLDHVNFKADPGEVVALVGMSGGGKTTLVNLVPRFYDVTSGVIRIDGVDIRDADLASLRRQIAIVTQEPILFNETVRTNIAYGNLNASQEAIIQAARDAYAYDFIQNFPEGFDTSIGELGSRLSGGEKQRLCIARALLKDAPILILDEATSALDSEAEIVVQKALENLMKGRTTFVIAHRLSTITHADRIVVLVKGRIVEEGTHTDLLAQDGAYRKLYQMQFGNSSNPAATVTTTPG
ncbi:MAG: ABC transporter ATP-binding protein [Desulfobacterales bacterium]|jgi:subfamily B ATP-binding cassette protein MsbA